MSLEFSASATKSGIVDIIYRRTGLNSTNYPIAEVTSDINSAMDMFLNIAIPASGKWQLDDTNHTKYNILTTALVENQRDYAFTTDEQGNLILDIYKVMVKAEGSDGLWFELDKVDQQADDSVNNPVDQMLNGANVTGMPDKYDKTGNSLFLDPIPNYSQALSLKVFINREGSYFATTDTTKKPGVPGILHEYFVVRPVALKCVEKGLNNANFWMNELLKWEGDESRRIKGKIAKYYANRAKDEQLVITSQIVNSI